MKFYLYTQKQNLGVFYLKLKENKKKYMEPNKLQERKFLL